MATIKQIKLPDNTVFDVEDVNAQPISARVTSISSSSTDSQYPTAKAVYDLIQSKIVTAIEGGY